MFPHERPASLRVAAVAVLVRAGLDELVGIRRPMRVMTACAIYLAFAIWHVRRPLQLRSPHLVTLQANFRLCLLQSAIFSQPRIVAKLGSPTSLNHLLYLVAIDARHSAGFMRTPIPKHMVRAARVAVETNRV